MNNEQLQAFKRSVSSALKAKTIVRTGMLPPAVWARIDCAGMLLDWRKKGPVQRVRIEGARAYFMGGSPCIIYVLDAPQDAEMLASDLDCQEVTL